MPFAAAFLFCSGIFDYLINIGDIKKDKGDYLSIAALCLWLSYIILQTIEILKWISKDTRSNAPGNIGLMHWLKLYNLAVLFMFSFFFAGNVLLRAHFLDIGSCFLESSVLIFISWWIYFRTPLFQNQGELLVGSGGAAREYSIKSEEIRKVPTLKEELSMEEKQEYSARLDYVLYMGELLLKEDLSIRELSREAAIASNQLSSFINSEVGLHFQDYINSKRIGYFLIMAKDPKWSGLTLEKMSVLSGFRSRTTFFRAFIKFKGKSPSKYLEMHRARGDVPRVFNS